jgi:CheY-like chemotaxis protein
MQTNVSATNDLAAVKLIMVVEDDEHIGTFIVQLIYQETRHFAIHHSTPGQALNWAAQHAPHLFILDYGLPEMNGLELHDQLRTFEHLQHAKSILISATSPPLSELKKRDMIFLAKPFNVLKLINLLEQTLI